VGQEVISRMFFYERNVNGHYLSAALKVFTALMRSLALQVKRKRSLKGINQTKKIKKESK